jgi:prepilin-type N-terminal cleavage/methylation domain-containing protein
MSAPRRGFSLVEILVSISLMAFLLTVGTQAFVQVRTFTRRMQAKQELHNTARIVFEQLRGDLSAVENSAAVYLVSHDGSGPDPKGVELVFLRGKLDHLDFTRHDYYGHHQTGVVDLVWARWAWDAQAKTLAVGASSPSRLFRLSRSWTSGGIEYQGQWFANLPSPRRVAGLGGPAVLDANAYGTGDPQDVGDYQDVVANSVPIARPCTAMRIEVVLQDGTVLSVDGSGNAAHALDGVLVDGSVTPAIGRRPRLVRVMFDLSDDSAHLTESFSFSVQTPGLLPL